MSYHIVQLSAMYEIQRALLKNSWKRMTILDPSWLQGDSIETRSETCQAHISWQTASYVGQPRFNMCGSHFGGETHATKWGL